MEGDGEGIDAMAGGGLDGAGAEGVAVARVAEAATASTSEPIPTAATIRAASPRASNPRGRLGNPIFMVSLDPLRPPFYFRDPALRAANPAEIGPNCSARPARRRTITG
jgi:hypothetical protein